MKDITLPLKLIAILADGQFHSGQKLGQKFGISRVAINQHIQMLKAWGLQVFTVTGRGYRLSAPLELLDQNKIEHYLPEKRVEVIPVINSTNQYLIDKIPDLISGDACVAEFQRHGRGRRGKVWFSPFASNLYLSIYWKLEQGAAAATGLSLVIGIILTEELHKLGAHNVKVKWPNDLYINQSKLAGILVEMNGKSGDIANVVIGIGLNLSMQHTDPDIVNQQWANLPLINIDRNQLVAKLVHALREALIYFEKNGLTSFISRWNKLDNFLNQPIKLLIGEQVIYGINRGINLNGALLLEQNGQITPYVGGDISLRADSTERSI